MPSLRELNKLSIKDRLLLIETFWDSLEERQIKFDVALKKELDQQLYRLEKGLSKTITRQELKKRIRSKR